MLLILMMKNPLNQPMTVCSDLTLMKTSPLGESRITKSKVCSPILMKTHVNDTINPADTIINNDTNPDTTTTTIDDDTITNDRYEKIVVTIHRYNHHRQMLRAYASALYKDTFTVDGTTSGCFPQLVHHQFRMEQAEYEYRRAATGSD
ncbi:unnamed protein product [Absidia cylindrospora]